jgi:regulatory protein
MELEAKGIDVNIILPFLSDKAFWGNLAAIVREKRFGKIIPTDYKEKAKQIRFLQYRGFTIEQINTT